MISKSPIYEMTNWAVVVDGSDGYMPPEMMNPCISGLCPIRSVELGGASDKPVRTSSVMDYDPEARIVTCYSGNKYALVGPPEPNYEEWCKQRGYDIDHFLGSSP